MFIDKKQFIIVGVCYYRSPSSTAEKR